jgi:hypothetical protein
MLLGVLISCAMGLLLGRDDSSATDSVLLTTKVIFLVAVIVGGILLVVHYCVPVPRQERNDNQPLLLGESDRVPIPRANQLQPQVWAAGYQYQYPTTPFEGAVFHPAQPYDAAAQ